MPPLDPFYPASRRTLIGETSPLTGTLLKSAARPGTSIRTSIATTGRRHWLRSLSLLTLGFVVGACGAGHGKWGSPGAAASGVASAVALQPQDLAMTAPRTVRVGALGVVSAPQKARRVVVREGDTVWTLAERYGDPDRAVGDTVEDLLHLNHLGPNANLIPGQAIEVP